MPGNLLEQIILLLPRRTPRIKGNPKHICEESFLEISNVVPFVFSCEEASNHKDKGDWEMYRSRQGQATEKPLKIQLQIIVFAHSIYLTWKVW